MKNKFPFLVLFFFGLCFNTAQSQNCFNYPITFGFGPNPEEITWVLRSEFPEQIVATGGPYASSLANSNFAEFICLEDGCYILEVNDSGDNGACQSTNPVGFGSLLTGFSGIGDIRLINYFYTAPALCSNFSFSVIDPYGFPFISEVGNYGSFTTGSFCVFTDGGVDTRNDRLITDTDLEDKINMTLYPNIANDVVTLSFATKGETSVNLNIYNATGNLIKSMKNQNVQNGQTMQLEVADLPKGSYFIKMSSYKHASTQRFFKF